MFTMQNILAARSEVSSRSRSSLINAEPSGSLSLGFYFETPFREIYQSAEQDGFDWRSPFSYPGEAFHPGAIDQFAVTDHMQWSIVCT